MADDGGEGVLDGLVDLGVACVDEPRRDRREQLARRAVLSREREAGRVDLGDVADGDDEGSGGDAGKVHRAARW